MTSLCDELWPRGGRVRGVEGRARTKGVSKGIGRGSM